MSIYHDSKDNSLNTYSFCISPSVLLQSVYLFWDWIGQSFYPITITEFSRGKSTHAPNLTAVREDNEGGVNSRAPWKPANITAVYTIKELKANPQLPRELPVSLVQAMQNFSIKPQSNCMSIFQAGREWAAGNQLMSQFRSECVLFFGYRKHWRLFGVYLTPYTACLFTALAYIAVKHS